MRCLDGSVADAVEAGLDRRPDARGVEHADGCRDARGFERRGFRAEVLERDPVDPHAGIGARVEALGEAVLGEHRVGVTGEFVTQDDGEWGLIARCEIACRFGFVLAEWVGEPPIPVTINSEFSYLKIPCHFLLQVPRGPVMEDQMKVEITRVVVAIGCVNNRRVHKVAFVETGRKPFDDLGSAGSVEFDGELGDQSILNAAAAAGFKADRVFGPAPAG